MKRATTAVIAAGCLVLLAGPVLAVQNADCGWEDGTGTILGFFGAIGSAANVTGPQVNTGARSLELVESPFNGTPQAYIIYVEGLTDGDTIDACFYGYDDTPAASPSLRIWGHYAQSGDVDSYAGSAGGNATYTDGSGWDQVCNSWVFDSDGNTRDALVVEVRLYSLVDGDTYYVDDASVTVSSDTATITTPCTGTVAIDPVSWGQLKADYR